MGWCSSACMNCVSELSCVRAERQQVPNAPWLLDCTAGACSCARPVNMMCCVLLGLAWVLRELREWCQVGALIMQGVCAARQWDVG